MTKRNYVTVNPCVMCQPMGSALAFKGIENTMVLYHGSQGCSTYMRLHLAHHFREPVDIASSSLSEKGAVYGGRENLKKGLKNVINRYNPKVIGVATTCLAETIGDDVPAIISEFKEEEGIGDDLEKDIIIIPVSTPSYGESHVSGYIKALDAVVRKFAENQGEKKPLKIPNGKLNLIPVESLSPADVRELKEILEATAGDYIFLPDISETFDAPLRDYLPKIAPGGTPLFEIRGYAEQPGKPGPGHSQQEPGTGISGRIPRRTRAQRSNSNRAFKHGQFLYGTGQHPRLPDSREIPERKRQAPRCHGGCAQIPLRGKSSGLRGP